MGETLAEAPVDEPLDQQPDEPTDVIEAEPEAVAAPEPEPGINPRGLRATLAALEAQNQQLAAAFGQLLERGATPQQAAAGAAEHAGFDPASLVDEFGSTNPAALVGFLEQNQQKLLSTLEARLEKIEQPLQQQQKEQYEQHVNGLVEDMIADDLSRNGDLPDEGKALLNLVGAQLMPGLQERYGNTPRTWEIAVAKAGEAVRAFAKAERDAAIAEHVNRNATLAGQHTEPNAAGLGVVTDEGAILPDGAVARKWGANAARLRST